MNFRNVLRQVMYKDRAIVYRKEKTKGKNGFCDQREAETPVYDGIPCKLSQYGRSLTADKAERATNIGLDLRLCCDPEYEILENDRVTVLHQGQTFNLFAGSRFAYPTHQEISLRRKMEAGNGHTA